MTPEQRSSLAQQITDNPLYSEVLGNMEAQAIERLIYEKDNTPEAQLRVQAIRAFRADLEANLNTRDAKGAPA